MFGETVRGVARQLLFSDAQASENVQQRTMSATRLRSGCNSTDDIQTIEQSRETSGFHPLVEIAIVAAMIRRLSLSTGRRRALRRAPELPQDLGLMARSMSPISEEQRTTGGVANAPLRSTTAP